MATFDFETVRLTDATAWPQVCVQCGDDATTLGVLPKRAAGNRDHVAVPVCGTHADHLTHWKARNRRSLLYGLAIIASCWGIVWLLQPMFNQANIPDPVVRGVVAFLVGTILALPGLIFLAHWARLPTRILMEMGAISRFSGASPVFVNALKEFRQAYLEDVPDDARFPVLAYQAQSQVTAPSALLLIVAALVCSALAATAMTLGAEVLEPPLQNCKLGDDTFIAFTVVAVLSWLVLAMGISPANPFQITAKTLAILASAAGLVKLGLMLKFRVFEYFSAPYSVLPLLVVQWAILYPLIVHKSIRHRVVVAVATLVGVAGYLLVVYVMKDIQKGPQQFAYITAPILGVILAYRNIQLATFPFCQECERWLVPDRIGSLEAMADQVQPALESGRILALTGMNLKKEAAQIGQVELVTYYCPDCEADGQTILELHECRGIGKKSKRGHLVCLDRWTYPGSAWVILHKMFENELTPPSHESDE